MRFQWRFLIAAALSVGTFVNAQIASEIEVLKFLANSTGNWANYNQGFGNRWDVNTADAACKATFVTGWTGITCEQINGDNRVVEIAFPFRQNINGTIGNINFNNLPYLRRLYVTETALTGTLPNLSTHPSLKSLTFSGNPGLLGPLNASNIPPQLETLSIRGSINVDPWNQGALPSFDAVNSTTLKTLNFDYAQITGTLPSFERFINLVDFSMMGNSISGGVPRFGPNVLKLSLLSNKLTAFDVGNIPITVQALDVSQNNIVAPFPDLSKLTDPRSIYLNGNGFFGSVPLARIPAPIFNGTYIVDFSSNSLTGAVPAFTSTWLQSRTTSPQQLQWSNGCNLFQTGVPSGTIAAFSSSCYDNQGSCFCPDKLPGSVSTGLASTGSNNNPSSTGSGPRSGAASYISSSCSLIIAVMAAFAATF